MADLLDTLDDARTALLGIPNAPPVLIRGDPDPGGDEVIVLDWVSDTARPAYGGSPTAKLVQVGCYAATLARALDLAQQARTALTAAGLRFSQSRPAPDPDAVGVLADYRRG